MVSRLGIIRVWVTINMYVHTEVIRNKQFILYMYTNILIIK